MQRVDKIACKIAGNRSAADDLLGVVLDSLDKIYQSAILSVQKYDEDIRDAMIDAYILLSLKRLLRKHRKESFAQLPSDDLLVCDKHKTYLTAQEAREIALICREQFPSEVGPVDQLIYELHLVDNLTFQEIAEITNVSATRCRVRYDKTFWVVRKWSTEMGSITGMGMGMETETG
jgi:DNA-directed RNA polymerase specialized sigma24 family protein